MAAPRLNRRLVLEAPVRVPDGAGGQEESWVELGTVWAELRARTGRDAEGEEAHLSVTGYRVTLRAAPYGAPSRPLPGQRFRDGARILAILSVAEADSDGRYLTCTAQEEVAL